MISPGIFYYWGPYLWKNKVTQEITNELLDRAKKSNIKYNEVLAGHIENQYRYNLEDEDFFAKLLVPYFDTYLKSGLNWYEKCNNNENFFLRLESLWINYMKKGEYNPIHEHDLDLSFVIYLQVPVLIYEENKNYVGRSGGPGSIEFIYGERMDNYLTKHYFVPEENDIFIFPSKLKHVVSPFKSDCERISVSGNLSIEYLK